MDWVVSLSTLWWASMAAWLMTRLYLFTEINPTGLDYGCVLGEFLLRHVGMIKLLYGILQDLENITRSPSQDRSKQASHKKKKKKKGKKLR